MDVIRSLLVVAGLAVAAPAWAGGGHDHDRHERHRNHGWHGDRHHSEWNHNRHHHHYGRSYAPAYSSYYFPPQPVYAAPPYPNYYYQPQPVYAAPAPGVHIVVPNIFIPLR